MRFLVLSRLRRQMVGSVAVATITGVLAGCSGDVVRFDDGFYTGSIPQSVPAQTNAPAQPYPGAIDNMATGSVAPSQTGYSNAGGGFVATPQASQPSGYPVASAASPVMQRNQLPPPPPPVYRRAPETTAAPVAAATPDMSAANDRVSVPRDRPMETSVAARSDAPATRGAPPTTLQEQATRLATPSPRPVREASRSTSTKASSQAPAGTVKVESGDTILAIARRSGVSADALRRANGLTSDTIRIGQTLTIPTGGTVPAASQTRVASAETKSVETSSPSAPAKKVETAKPAQVAAKSGRVAQDAAPSIDPNPTGSVSKEVREQVAAVAPNSTGIDQFRWPVQGRVLKRFGEKVDGRRNDGLNISVPRGTPVKAAENGVVIYSGNGLKEFGNTILVKHDNGLVTVYGHADTLLVDKGAKVRRGQEIAKSGMSGDTDVPVLHFEVRKNSAPVDPTKYLQ